MIPAPTSLSSEKTLALLSIQFRPKINSALPQRPTGRKSPGCATPQNPQNPDMKHTRK